MEKSKIIGVVGGSGLYHLDGLEDVKEIQVETPFGSPSDAIISGKIGETTLLFLPRHGRGHKFLPSEVPYRANIWALKSLGADWIIGVSAVGSLKEEIEPGHVVLPDQFCDLTRLRAATFFGDGLVAHVSVADPICHDLQKSLAIAAERANAKVHLGGTYLCMEGPAFSTRAESRLYRSWGMDIIGMTNMPEAKLAREAEVCFATLALATDYDCWHVEAGNVSVDTVVETLKNNIEQAKAIIRQLVDVLVQERTCPCTHALRDAILSDKSAIPESARNRLDMLVGKYF